MSYFYKEASFPADYRAAQVGQVMRALYRLRSIAIVGLAGMGKSNVARFIVSHPQVPTSYLRARADALTFLHVDCAGLARSDEAGLLYELIGQASRAGITPAGHRSPLAADDLRAAWRDCILGLDPARGLAVIFDYFDEIAGHPDRGFYNYLAHLRNLRPQANLAYVFVTRRLPRQLSELQELLDDPCFIGPLNGSDALASIGRDEARLDVVFTPAERDALRACTGGHPGLLKNACELAASRQVDLGLPQAEVTPQLLASTKVRSLCAELWADLTPEEQALLGRIADGATPAFVPPDLERYGILAGAAGGAGQPRRLRIFSPLFEQWVRQALPSTSGVVRISAVPPNQALIEAPGGEARVPLTPKLFALLSALSEARDRVLSSDEIIGRVYPNEEAGVSDAALSQLVKRLRDTLDPPARRIAGDGSYSSVETVRDIGFRFNG